MFINVAIVLQDGKCPKVYTDTTKKKVNVFLMDYDVNGIPRYEQILDESGKAVYARKFEAVPDLMLVIDAINCVDLQKGGDKVPVIDALRVVLKAAESKRRDPELLLALVDGIRAEGCKERIPTIGITRLIDLLEQEFSQLMEWPIVTIRNLLLGCVIPSKPLSSRRAIEA